MHLDLHGLIFETSICYWQDQPGSCDNRCRAVTPPRGRHHPRGVCCAAREVWTNSGQRGYREDLESALQGKPGGWGRCSCEATPAFPAAATCFRRLSQTGRLSLAMERFGTVTESSVEPPLSPAWRRTRGNREVGPVTMTGCLPWRVTVSCRSEA